MRRDWPKGIRRDVIHARMLLLEGPEFPAHYLSVWADQLGLARPGGFRRAQIRVAHAASVRASKRRAAERKAARAAADGTPAPAMPPEDDEDAEVALLSAGVMRQTPALLSALDLLAEGVPPATIRDRVKLTATEFAKVREMAAQKRAA